jgi:hypothetical protein
MIPEILVSGSSENRQMATIGVGTSAITILVKPVITFSRNEFDFTGLKIIFRIIYILRVVNLAHF